MLHFKMMVLTHFRRIFMSIVLEKVCLILCVTRNQTHKEKDPQSDAIVDGESSCMRMNRVNGSLESRSTLKLENTIMN